MEKPIIIAPLICLPPMKEVHAMEKKRGGAVSEEVGKNKPKPIKSKNRI